MRSIATSILITTLGLSLTGRAQSPQAGELLTLQEAVSTALRQTPEHRAATLGVDAARAAERLQKTAWLPAISFTESATRGNDPVYVFGARLRQQRFTKDDFALNQLNTPKPLGSFATRFSGEWLAFDFGNRAYAGRGAAQQTASAQTAATRAGQQIVYRVVAGYRAVMTEEKQFEVARHQVETAQALLAASQARVGTGVAVASDELLAQANLAARQQEQIAAEGDLAIAWAELERAVGAPISEDRRRMSELHPLRFEPAALEEAIATALRARPDRQSLEHETAAAHAGVQEARSALAPTLHAYGDWEADRGSFAGSGGNNWMVGAELRMDLFPAAKRQQLELARIAEQRTRVTAQSAAAQIRLEVTRAWFGQQSAARMVEAAQASLAQTAESLRILRNRYNAGLATMNDLLRGEDAERQSQASYWAAVSRNAVAWCELKFAMGTLDAGVAGDLQ